MLMAARRTGRILCPKCRALGSTTDCTDSIKHARRSRGNPVSDAFDDEPELIVTLTFAVPGHGDDEELLREKATRLHDEWLNDPEDLIEAFRIVGDDFDLQVKPLNEP